jgi:hypothetical protein
VTEPLARLAPASPPATLSPLQRDDAAIDRSMVTMAAFLLSQGWTERREGVFGVGPGDTGDDDEAEGQLSAVDGSAA